MRKTAQIIESVSEWSGRLIAWFGLALALLLSFEIFMRHVLNNPTSYTYEIASMMGVAIGAGGLAYTHLHQGHVRVDVLWRLLPPRWQAITDLIGGIIFFFPLLIVLVYVSTLWVIHSYELHEISTETYMYPIIWPVRLVLLLGVILLLTQGVATFIRDFSSAREGKPR